MKTHSVLLTTVVAFALAAAGGTFAADPHQQAAGEPTKLVLGDPYRVRNSSGLRAELGHVLGPDSLAA